MNQVNLIGRLGEDVKLTTFENGGNAASFSLATNEFYTNSQGEKVQKTEWHNIVAHGATAENCAKYLRKGSQIALTGRLATRNYEKENVKHYVTEIVAKSVTFLDSGTATDETE